MFAISSRKFLVPDLRMVFVASVAATTGAISVEAIEKKNAPNLPRAKMTS
jgi:hypothetical protein